MSWKPNGGLVVAVFLSKNIKALPNTWIENF